MITVERTLKYRVNIIFEKFKQHCVTSTLLAPYEVETEHKTSYAQPLASRSS